LNLETKAKMLIKDKGSILSIKILRSRKFSEKARKFLTGHFFRKGKKKYLADVVAQLTN
jgi:hypothetical protein